jgi:FSR family fosmidomycin resistance protein-like MFS transporter
MTITAEPAAQPVAKETFHTADVLSVSFAHGIHDMYTSFLSPLLPVLIENLSLTKTAASLLSVFYQWPSLLQPFIGAQADRVDLRLLVVLGPAITAAMMTLLGIAPGYSAALLLMVVAGLSSAGLHAIGPVIAGMRSGSQLGRGMSYWMVAGELARTFGPVILVASVSAFTPRGLPWLMIGGVAASLLLYFRMRRLPDYRPPRNTGIAWGEALSRMRPLLLPIGLVIATRALLFSAVTTFLPTFLTEEGASLWLAGASLSIMEAAGVAGALAGGVVSDRLGRRRILIVMTLVGPLAVLLFLASRGWLRIPALLLMGLTLLSTTPALMALVLEQAKAYRALANGIYMALNFVLSSAAVLVVGILADRYGLRAAITISTVIMLVGLPSTLLLPADRRQG